MWLPPPRAGKELCRHIADVTTVQDSLPSEAVPLQTEQGPLALQCTHSCVFSVCHPVPVTLPWLSELMGSSGKCAPGAPPHHQHPRLLCCFAPSGLSPKSLAVVTTSNASTHLPFPDGDTSVAAGGAPAFTLASCCAASPCLLSSARPFLLRRSALPVLSASTCLAVKNEYTG